MRIIFCAALWTLSLLAAANQHALLIGVEQYEDDDRISSLSAANADARALEKALVEVAGFPKENVRLLVSDGTVKPSRRNILFELGQLRTKVKPGDTVFFLFSGHGIQIEGEAFLLPWDADVRNDEALAGTAVAARDVRDILARLPAKVLIASYDMCRNDPKKGSRDVTKRNNLNKVQTKDLVLAADTVPAGATGGGPRAVVTLFSCSPGQRSWEWQDKKRGFFSYFLEQGIRQEAADQSGQVKIRNLTEYLVKAVSGAVKREVGQEQEPYYETSGPVHEIVLAAGRPVGGAGQTAVPIKIEDTAKARYDVAFQRAIELQRLKRYDAAKERYEEALGIMKTAQAAHGAGECSRLLGDKVEAEKFFRMAMGIDAKFAPPVNALAEMSKETAPNAKATEDLMKKAIDLDGANPTFVNNLAVFKMSRKEYAEAARLFQGVIELDPGDATAYYNLAVLKMLTKAPPAEIDPLFKKATTFDPTNALYFVDYGIFRYNLAKDLPGAEAAFRRAMELGPTMVEPVAMLGTLYFDGKADYKQAEQFYRRAVELAPTSGVHYANLAGAVLRQGRRSEALELAKKAMALGRKQHWVYGELGIGS